MLYKRPTPAKQKNPWRLKLLAFTAALCMLASLYGAMGYTFLWFTSRDAVTNKFAAAQPLFSVQAVDIYEKGDVPPNPGDEIEKVVGAVNSGSQPAFTRLMVLAFFTAPGEDGIPALLPAEIGRHIALDTDTAHWQDGGDGYYYYLHALAGGAAAEHLFTHVTIADDLPVEYHGATLSIEVKCEGVSTARWAYRQTWWGSADEPVNAEWLTIDQALRGAATG